MHERVYQYLVQAGRACAVHEVAADLGLTPRATAGLLRALERQSLVDRTTTRPPGFVASPPEIALEPLLARRRDDLVRIRAYARELQRTFSQAAGGRWAGELIEVVAGPEQVGRYHQHLMRGARVGVDALLLEASTFAEAVARGVQVRSVYDTASLPAPEPGLQARAAPDLPVGFTLVDRQVGLVPLDTLTTAVVRPSPLLVALGALFEAVWDRAVPILSTMDPAGAGELDERSRQVLLLMSEGLKDESIARALGLSRRTVQKSVTLAMTRLGARTRFQAALLAHDRGWLS
ncbi:MAG TPA: LuxR C-terminal-related transcriptional regulator [Candidatus Limnocylindria bacterium]|nr:LuxR C-terminal-related transcriptional regulator [Candidatus Limnocylindria bacterium]